MDNINRKCESESNSEITIFDAKINQLEEHIKNNHDKIYNNEKEHMDKYELNHNYYIKNKILLRSMYPNKKIIIYNEKVIAKANTTEEICKQWFDLVDEKYRFDAVIAYIPETAGVFI
jgi:hypothetical protein